MLHVQHIYALPPTRALFKGKGRGCSCHDYNEYKNSAPPSASYQIGYTQQQKPIAEPFAPLTVAHDATGEAFASSADNEARFSIPRKPISSTSTNCPPKAAPKSDTTSHKYSALSEKSRKRTSKRQASLLHNWWLESLCCLLALIAFLAIVFILLPYEGKTLPQWPYQLSINTILAIFVNILKASMTLVVAEGLSNLKWAWFRESRPLQDLTQYDMASRGPLGSVRLLFSLRGRDIIACVGAVLTIAVLAVDPFTQEVTQHYSCTIKDKSIQATIPRTNMYFDLSRAEHGLSLGMLASLSAGIYSNGTSTIPFSCPTGTCTFPEEYYSIAYCHTCVDVTSQLIIISDVNGSNHSVNFTLPSGLSLFDNGDSDVAVPLLMKSDSSGNIEIILTSYSPDQAVGMPNASECAATKNQTFGCNGVGAASCSLQPCVKTYRGAVSGGNLTEHLISTWTDFGQGQSTSNAVNVGCLNATDRRSVAEAGYVIEPGAKWLAYNTSISAVGEGWQNRRYPDDPVVKGIISEKCLYEMSAYTSDQISGWSENFFQGNMTFLMDGQPTGPTVVEVFYYSILLGANIATVDSLFRSLVDSLTAHIRLNGVTEQSPDASNPATGFVIQGETCIHVRWAWLVFPATLVVLTIIFFVAMVLGARRGRNGNYVWKSSPLALVYHGLAESTLSQQDLAELNDVDDMVEAAKELHVQLIRTEHGLKFTGME